MEVERKKIEKMEENKKLKCLEKEPQKKGEKVKIQDLPIRLARIMH